MNLPFEWRVGWRYTRAGRSTRHNSFISFISAVSVLGIALGVATLIIVLSVMNGFQKEVRDRMLSVVAHVELYDAGGLALTDWQALAAKARQDPRVLAAAPFVPAQALVARGEDLKGVMVRGILPQVEEGVTPLAQANRELFERLQPGRWGALIGVELARSLDVHEGDTISLVAPSGEMTPAGVLPRIKQVKVAGIFNAGHFEYDSGLVLLHLQDAARLFRTGGPTGVQLRLQDPQLARSVADNLAERLGPQVLVQDWTHTNRAWFDAVQIEKRMMRIILTLIVAVAAFNLLSTLVMTVTDKQADIAILRTLGASPRSIMAIFVIQGGLAGVLGTLGGLGLGLLVAFNIDVIVPAIEHVLGVHFLPGSIYLISKMPSDPQASDIVPITLISLVLALLATLYPSWRASRMQPAEALRYE